MHTGASLCLTLAGANLNGRASEQSAAMAVAPNPPHLHAVYQREALSPYSSECGFRARKAQIPERFRGEMRSKTRDGQPVIRFLGWDEPETARMRRLLSY
jgi:hypothetical protein